MTRATRIVLFARAPVPGRVKTRLKLEPALACRLHEAFVADSLGMLGRFGGIELSTDAATAAWPAHRGPRTVQCEGGLGRRLLHAFHPAPVLVLGSDSPDLPASHVEALLAAEADVALGPTEDGGYWGILCRRPHPAMFDGVEWSTGRTFETTRDAIARAGLTCAAGPQWYDIDGPGDLERLARSANGSRSAALARECLSLRR